MNVNVYFIEDYENEIAFRPKKTNPNKPNSNPNKACPERSEFTLSVIEGNGPILERMNLNFYATVYYDSKLTFAANNQILQFTTTWNCGARIVA